MKVVLHLTTACNLRCRYCYAPRDGGSTMELETARRAIDLVVDLGERSACVSFFGGEPLLRFDLVRELTRYAEERGRAAGKEMHFRLSTNGTLFTEEILRFCRDHGVLFALSIDGDLEAHDRQRVFPDGRGSFEALDRKLDMIVEHNPWTVVASVVTPETVDRLAPSIEYLWSRGLRFFAHQPAWNAPGWSPERLEVLEESYRRLAAFYLDRVRAGEHFHMSLFDDKLKSHARSPIVPGAICDFGARKVSVAPDGRIFPCVQLVSDRPDAEGYCIGHVETGLTHRWQELVEENRRERPDCVGCALLGRCANYCACANWQSTGDITRVPGVLCAHERMLVPIADELGNRLWDERNRTFLRKHYRDFEERFPYLVD